MKEITSLFARTGFRYEVEKEIIRANISGRRVSIVSILYPIDRLYAFFEFPAKMDIIEVLASLRDGKKKK